LYGLPKSHLDLQVLGGMCLKWGLKNLCAVIQDSGEGVQWPPKVGVALRVTDWHIPHPQPFVPQGS
jgi:hypothetical protein